jgi:predicted lipoprotein with Yx(FWY)xxD motif
MNVRKEIRVRRIRTLPTLLVVAAALVALVVAACGSSGGDDVKAAAPAASANMSAPSGGNADLAVRSGSLGKILADSQGRTLYLFEKDTGTMSNCSGACAGQWPPAPAGAHPKAGSGLDAALLGTTTRSDGSQQLTYGGHPLYRFVGDRAVGDTKGQNVDAFGAEWYVVSPAGKKVEGKATTTSNGGGYGY